MKKLSKILALVLAMVMVFTLAACSGNTTSSDATGNNDGNSVANNDGGNAAASDGEQIKAVMISVMSGGTYWGPIEEGWKETGESYGWQTDYWTPVTTNSQTEMIELAESAITQGYKILCVCGTDENMWEDVLTRAKDNGCIVIGVAADMPSLIEFCVGPEYYTLGYTYGEYIANMMNNDGVAEANLFTVQTAFTGGTGQDEQRQGFLDAMNEHFNGPVNDLGAETCDSQTGVAQDKMNAVYLIHPEMNVYYGLETYSMIAGGSFVEEHGLQHKFYNGAPDTEVENLQLVLDGVFTTVGQLDCYGEGAACASNAKTLLEGGTVEQHYIPVPYVMADASNLRDYLDTFGVSESDLNWPD